METYTVKIIGIDRLTHDVIRIKLEKPFSFTFTPGQSVDISINKEGWENGLRAFTFTSLPSDEYLEFVIKTYISNKGVTRKLPSLVIGDELIIHHIFGDLKYKGEGIFFAGGAGVTPFLSILNN